MEKDSSPEFGGPAGVAIVKALNSELRQLFVRQWQLGTCALRQPEDLSEPADVVLAGTIDDSLGEIAVVISQRADRPTGREPTDEDVSYLVQLQRGKPLICLVTADNARQVHDGMPELNETGAALFRLAIHPEYVSWSASNSQQATTTDHYQWLRRYQAS